MKKLLILIFSIMIFQVGAIDFQGSYLNYSGMIKASEKVQNYDLDNYIEGIINWKKSNVGATSEEYLFNQEFLKQAGTTSGDWFPIGLGRYGYDEDYNAYLGAITSYINEKYQTVNKLDKYKATEWHRISLAIISCGGDPTSIISNNGDTINLIKDGTYDRGIDGTSNPGRQGINGWIWALIAVDSKRYSIPNDSLYKRQDFIVEIMKNQLSDGGFAIMGQETDPDTTAMALQALAPYANSEVVYNYDSNKLKDENGNKIKISKTVSQVINESLSSLSKSQKEDGDFASFGVENAESTAQVIVALSTLGINIFEDQRFIKNNNTLLDVLLKYRLSNGGFIHSISYDINNPSTYPTEANSMASSQALYSLVSLNRFLNKQRSLYDTRNEFTLEEKELIATTNNLVNNLTDSSSLEEVDQALASYYNISSLDRCYVNNYLNLSKQAKRLNLKLPDEDEIFNGTNDEETGVLLYFSESNKKSVDDLPEVNLLTTEYYNEVIRLKYIIDNAENKEENKAYQVKLEKSLEQINLLQTQIDDLNSDIKDKLYPFDKITIKDMSTIEEIMKRYESLSTYDQTKIEGYDDVIKGYTQAKNLKMAFIISGGLLVVAIALTIAIVYNIKRRKSAKKLLESDE